MHPLPLPCRPLAAALVTAVLLLTRVTARAADEPQVARAREILARLTAGQYAEFVAYGDATMRAAFSAEQAGIFWTGLAVRLGNYRAEESAQLVRAGGSEAVRFVLRFERGTCTLRVVLDTDGRMTGFWCDAVNAAFEYKPPAYVDPDAFREESVTVSAGQFPLPGTLTLPKRPGPFAAVVLVHGSGPHDADETVGAIKPFRDLAWGLATRGIAVLRYEKRTKVHPLAKPAAEWTPADETTDDALAAVQLLRKRGDIDPRRVYILGHSLGGMLAPYIARQDEKLGGIIIMAATARSILDVLEDQTEYLARLGGEPSELDRAELARLRQRLAAVRAGKAAETEPILGVPAVYWERLHKLDPAGTAAQLKLPILVLQGGRDYQVTRKDFAVWEERLQGRDNARLRLLENLNHLFVAGEGRSTPAEYQQAGHVDAAVIALIADWIGRWDAAGQAPP